MANQKSKEKDNLGNKSLELDELVDLELDLDIDLNLKLENTEPIKKKSLKRTIKNREFKFIKKKEILQEVIKSIPKKNESIHCVSDGKFDFFSIIPLLLDILINFEEIYVSTWTMNRQNIIELINFFDEEKIKKISVLTGLYFKRRETAVYAKLLLELSKRNQKIVSFKNHAKIILIKKHKEHIIIEGSANLTANPRTEQFVMSNDINLYNFHKGWMDGMLNG